MAHRPRPPSISDLEVTFDGNGRPSLSWSYPNFDGLSQGRVYADGQLVATVGAGQSAYVYDEAPEEAPVTFDVRVVDTGYRESKASNTVTVTTGDLYAPDAPTGLRAVEEDGQVRLGWNAVPGASYEVYRAVAPGPTTLRVSTGATSYTDTADNGTTYYYRVVAVEGGKSSDYSAEVTATPQAAPVPAVTIESVETRAAEVRAEIRVQHPAGVTAPNVTATLGGQDAVIYRKSGTDRDGRYVAQFIAAEGAHLLSVSAEDYSGQTGSASQSVTVGTPVAFERPPITSVREETTYSYTGRLSKPAALTAVALPPWLTLSTDGTQFTIAGTTPSVGADTSYTVTLEADDGTFAAVQQSFTLEVRLNPTGAGSAALILPSASGTGKWNTTYVAAGSAPLILPTASGAGRHTATNHQGDGYAVLPIPEARGTGVRRAQVLGSGQAALLLPTASGQGALYQLHLASGGATLLLPQASGTGHHSQIVNVASGTAPLILPTATGAGGHVATHHALGGAALPLPTASGAGALNPIVNTGAGSAALPVPTASGAGQKTSSYLGNGQATLLMPTAIGGGSRAPLHVGSGGATLILPEASGAGVQSAIHKYGSGSAALPVPAATGAGQLTLVHHAAGSATLLMPVASGTGAADLAVKTGAGSAALILPSASGTGYQFTPVTGAGAITLPMPGGVGTGTLTRDVQGAGTATLPLPTASGTGALDLAIKTGSGSAALVLPTAAGVGAHVRVHVAGGQATLLLPTASGAAEHQSVIYGGGQAALPLPTASGTGDHTNAVFTGAGAATLPLPSAFGSGVQVTPITGTGAATLTLPAASGTGALSALHESTGSAILPMLGGAGTGTRNPVLNTGAGAATLTLPTASGAGTIQELHLALGTAAIPLPSAFGSGVLDLAVKTGSGSAALPMPSAAGAGDYVRVHLAGGGATLILPTASGAGDHNQLVNTGAGSAALLLPTASGTGTVSALHAGNGQAALILPTASGAGVHDQLVNTGAGSATLILPAASGTGVQLTPVTSTGAAAMPMPTASGTGAYVVDREAKLFGGYPASDWTDTQGAVGGTFDDTTAVKDTADVTFAFKQVDVPASPQGILLESGASGDGMGLFFDPATDTLVGAAGKGNTTTTGNTSVFVSVDASLFAGQTVNIYWCIHPASTGRAKIYVFDHATGAAITSAATDISDGSQMGTQDPEGDWTGFNEYGVGVASDPSTGIRDGVYNASFNGTMNQGAEGWNARLPVDFDQDAAGTGVLRTGSGSAALILPTASGIGVYVVNAGTGPSALTLSFEYDQTLP